MIQLDVDLTNPGQFFACCGVFELAQRLWPRATARFDGAQFVVSEGDLKELVAKAAQTPLDVLEPTNQTSSALRLREKGSCDVRGRRQQECEVRHQARER